MGKGSFRGAVAWITCGSVVLLSGCGGSTRHTSPVVGPSLRHLMAPGFSAPGTNTAGPSPSVLDVRPITQLHPAELHRAPQPSSELRSASLALVNQPVRTRVQPLLVSSQTLHPGETIAVAAGRLGTATVHAALFVLLGPTYRAQRLVQVRYGVAAAGVTLPKSMASGTWALGAEDVSQLYPGAHHQVRGTALLDIGIFTI